MNLFVLCRGAGDEHAAAEAVRSVAEPYLEGAAVQTWRAPSGRAVLAWVAHAGLDYVSVQPQRVAWFAGRPAGTLDPWALVSGGLEGRGTAAAYDDENGGLRLVTDALGSYPVFAAGSAVSNSAEVLRRLHGTTTIDQAAVASLVAGGWPISGHPMWADVRRRLDLLPARTIAEWFSARDFDPEAAAAALVESLGALAGWPGRPDVVPVTAGRDSRLILAAALRAGIDFRAVTVGGEGAPDVVAARALCAIAGVEHERLDVPPGGTLHHREAAERTAIIGGGATTAEAPGGIPAAAVPAPLAVWHSGQGGEIARAVYGRGPRGAGRAVDHLYTAFVARRPGRPELLSTAGAELVRGEIERWAAGLLDAGLSTADLPDAFYLLQRMSHWAAMGHSVTEWIRDTTSPLWSAHVVAHMLALPAARRAREAFHIEVLRVLAPELAGVPLADGSDWSAEHSAWAQRRRRAVRLASRAAAEARRRGQWLRSRDLAAPGPASPARPLAAPPPPGSDPLTALMADLRAWVAATPDHPVLAVFDRDRVLQLLERPPATLDFIRHAQVMRLATVVLAADRAEER